MFLCDQQVFFFPWEGDGQEQGCLAEANKDVTRACLFSIVLTKFADTCIHVYDGRMDGMVNTRAINRGVTVLPACLLFVLVLRTVVWRVELRVWGEGGGVQTVTGWKRRQRTEIFHELCEWRE